MHGLPLLTTVAAILTSAWVLGIITQKLGLSPIVGYLLAGIAVGPYTPGFVGDLPIASQLAEMGVILLMFGVGLHFHPRDLIAVRRIAVPGALGQSIGATLLSVLVALAFGWSVQSGLVLGMAMAVASTVVLMRVLEDHHLLDTAAGHAAVGWLIVEDVLTVIVLVLIPTLGAQASGGQSLGMALLWALLRLGALGGIILLAGVTIIPWSMMWVARLRSRELFTLTVLMMAVAIAVGSAHFFGASLALGAFLAGMAVGQSPVSQQAAADALPLRDAFAVMFFASVGMLFDPAFIIHEPLLLISCLSIVMLCKPLLAIAIVALLGYPVRTALIIAVGLAQIGEFSFILAELGKQHGLLDDRGHHVLVACAMVSITLNPLLFRSIDWIENRLRTWPVVWNLLTRKASERENAINEQAGRAIEAETTPLAVVVGFGPVGATADELLRKNGLETVVVDLNLDTVQSLRKLGRNAIYGDAFNIEIMHQALARATHLVIALSHSVNRNPLIVAAKLIDPKIKIFVRARHLLEREELMQAGADFVCFEEAEAAVGLAKLVLSEQGAKDEQIRAEVRDIRRKFQPESLEVSLPGA